MRRDNSCLKRGFDVWNKIRDERETGPGKDVGCQDASKKHLGTFSGVVLFLLTGLDPTPRRIKEEEEEADGCNWAGWEFKVVRWKM